MKLTQGQKLLFIGDSITDCERAVPAGEGLFHALGKGYVAFVDAMLQAVYPELGIRVVNKGIGGNTVRDLKNRWQEDVLDQQPDWLVVMIGVNDVWRQFDTPFIKDWHVYEEEFESTLRELIERAQPKVRQLVILSPFYIEMSTEDRMRRKMDEYGAIASRIAEQTGCLFVNTQDAFNAVLKELYAATLSWDRVHPTFAGHMILARAFLKEIGFDWNRSL